MDLDRVDVVLVRPARAANVAAAARALKNMGLGTLVLVDPPPGLEAPDARALAYGAWDLLDAARRKTSLREAVDASTWTAESSGPPPPEAWHPRRRAAQRAQATGGTGGGGVAVVFGPEASGLSDEELARCHVRVHIPSDPAHPSLNLAQAVLLIAYELRLAALADSRRTETDADEPPGGGTGPRATAGGPAAAPGA